jgi:hypothetical protein
VVAAEAEDFVKQTHDDVRRWYLVTPDTTPDIGPDADTNHAVTASGQAYLEILPDTRQTPKDALVHGENFQNQPGLMAILYYDVEFSTTGRYYVWGRIFSTGPDDNGLHVGIDGEWPESGRRMQWMAKRRWAWASKQRTHEVHTGVPYQLYLDVTSPGKHAIMFSMREDGTEFDKWLMTTQRLERVEGPGPEPVIRSQ